MKCQKYSIQRSGSPCKCKSDWSTDCDCYAKPRLDMANNGDYLGDILEFRFEINVPILGDDSCGGRMHVKLLSISSTLISRYLRLYTNNDT